MSIDSSPVKSDLRFGSIPRWWFALIGVFVLSAFPLLFSNPSVTSIAVFTVLYMAAASSWNTFSGYSGYISFGHTVFFGVGAYTVALLGTAFSGTGTSGVGALIFVPVAALTAGLVALPYGVVALRTRRIVFIIVTLATFFLVQLLAYNLPFTGGTSGLVVPSPNWPAIEFNDVVYYCALFVLAGTVALTVFVRRSRLGLQLLAIRDDETRAQGLGVETSAVKLLAFVLSAVPIGVVGGLYAYFLGTIFPDVAFTPVFDLTMLLFAIVGGLGTISGPLLGALVLQPIGQYLALVAPNANWNLMLYGVVLLVVIVALPTGVVPGVSRKLHARMDRHLGRWTYLERSTSEDGVAPAESVPGKPI